MFLYSWMLLLQEHKLDKHVFPFGNVGISEFPIICHSCFEGIFKMRRIDFTSRMLKTQQKAIKSKRAEQNEYSMTIAVNREPVSSKVSAASGIFMLKKERSGG